MRIALLGFGQIGGSIALALERRRPDWTLAGWSPSGDGPGRAAAEGVLERSAASLADAVGDANIVVLAAPPLASIDLLDQLAATALPSGAIVTDVCSTKRRIVDRAASLGLPFVGGHPMAGREASGYASADADLFVDRPWVICPDGDVGAATTVESLVLAVGARPVRLDADVHDAAVASISHLPLVLSAALVETVVARAPGWDIAESIAAGGWASMSRLARGDVDMGAGILATNGDEVASRLRVLRDAIDDWLAALDRGDPDVLRERLMAARALLERE